MQSDRISGILEIVCNKTPPPPPAIMQLCLDVLSVALLEGSAVARLPLSLAAASPTTSGTNPEQIRGFQEIKSSAICSSWKMLADNVIWKYPILSCRVVRKSA